MALVFRAEAFAATDFEAAVPDLAAVLDAADAAFLDATEVALRDATDVAWDRLDAAVVFRDVEVRLDGVAGRVALVFEALLLTDEVFPELFVAEAFAIVFALLAGALDATAFEAVVLAALVALAVAGLARSDFAPEDLGGMVGTLPS